jgi:hypothetical protein
VRKHDGKMGRLHNEDFNNKYLSPNVIRIKKLRKIELAEYVAGMGQIIN